MAAPAADRTPEIPDPSYATHAWLREGHHAVPGVLALHDGRLSFRGEGKVVFDERAGASAVSFPWYRFGGELAVTVSGHRHRLALTPPHGDVAGAHADAADGSRSDDADKAGEAAEIAEATEIADAADGRRAGRIWRTLLVE